MKLNWNKLNDYCENRTFRDSFIHANNLNPNGGLCLEFGVGMGRSFSWSMAYSLQNKINNTIIGFDSFQGLPKETNGVWYPHSHSEGFLSWSKDFVFSAFVDLNLFYEFQNYPDKYKFIEGWFEDTCTKELQNSFCRPLSYVNIDCDIHCSTVTLLEFIKPLLRVNTVLYFDDWKDPAHTPDAIKARGRSVKWGEHLALEEFLNKYPNIKLKMVCSNELNQRYFSVVSI